MFPTDLQTRRLYYIYGYIGLALCVLAGNLVAFAVPIRAGLSMEQFGLIIGIGQFIPAVINLLTAPHVTRLGLEYWAVIILPLLRILLGICFVGIAILTQDKTILTTGFAVIFVLYMTCPYLSNNALQAIIKRTISESELGRHTSRLVLWQTIPSTLLGIVMTWGVEYFDRVYPGYFNWWVLGALMMTAPFQLFCSVIAWRMMKTEAQNKAAVTTTDRIDIQPQHDDHQHAASSTLQHSHNAWSHRLLDTIVAPLLPPFLDPAYRKFLSVFFILAIVSGMSTTFIFPYFTSNLGWSLTVYQLATSAVTCASGIFMPAWGALTDRVGGRNSIQAAHIGMALSLFILATGQTWAGWAYLFLGYYSIFGLFGSGVTIGQQYLTVAYADKRLASTYIAALTAIGGLGAFIGALIGGLLLSGLQRTTQNLYESPVHYEIYFMIVGVGHVLASWSASLLQDHRPRLSRPAMANQLMLDILTMLRLRRP